jgi:hypothetical protein
MKRTVLLLGIALLLSLGLNALLWTSRPSPEAASGTTGGPADSVVVSATNDHPEETECWVELADCRADANEESETAVRMFTHPDGAVSTSETDEETSAEPMPREVDEELQEQVLCTVALTHLREDWEEQRDQTIQNLARSLADEEERSAMRERDVSRAAQLFEVPEDERARFETEYRALWDERVGDLQSALDADPPDTAAALTIAKGLFEDEDELATRLFGDMGRRRIRVAQTERRTVVLALLAALANVEWDDAISW